MGSNINIILKSAILAAKSDRVEFVEQLSSVISERIGSSQQQAQQFMEQAQQTIETLDRQQLLEQLVDLVQHKDIDDDRLARLETKIDRLTEAVELLNQNTAKQ